MDEYKKFAERIAREAGKIMKDYFGIGMMREYKADTSPVTEADLKINSLVIQEISKVFPGHSILGEEESNIIHGSEYTWVCDPIDGTIPFTLGLPLSTFSLALVKEGVVLLGVVFDPFCDRLYSAVKGAGATLNGKVIYVSKHASLDRVRIEYEMFSRAKYDLNPFSRELTKRGAGLIQLCSYINSSMLCAAGELAATIFPHTSGHDAATVKIIVEEAGGKVTDLFGNEQRYDQPINGAIASNGILHDELIALAKTFITEQQHTP